MAAKQDFYKFIQKTSEESDPRYEPYLQHATGYMANIILLGNTIVLLLITLIIKNKLEPPKYSMLGKLINAHEYEELFKPLIKKSVKQDIDEFNKSLNLVKHSIIGMSPDNIKDPVTITLFDLKERQAVSVTKKQQEENIALGQKIIAAVGKLV